MAVGSHKTKQKHLIPRESRYIKAVDGDFDEEQTEVEAYEDGK
jgi:hypothetical protein